MSMHMFEAQSQYHLHSLRDPLPTTRQGTSVKRLASQPNLIVDAGTQL